MPSLAPKYDKQNDKTKEAKYAHIRAFRKYALESNKYLNTLLLDLIQIYNAKYFSYRIFSIRVAYSIYEYLLIIPKSIPSFIAKLLKENKAKEEIEYGYGNFIDLNRDYIRSIDSNIEANIDLNIQGKILLSPNGCEKVMVMVG